MRYWIEENRLDFVARVCQIARSWQEAVIMLSEKHGIKTNSNTLSTVCTKYKIPRPKISKNWGGVRRGDGVRKVFTNKNKESYFNQAVSNIKTALEETEQENLFGAI